MACLPAPIGPEYEAIGELTYQLLQFAAEAIGELTYQLLQFAAETCPSWSI